ncbi:hypothetical protein Hdeb2414_s0022g00618131 [Helianthus debilis subsp. tardiflorus]
MSAIHYDSQSWSYLLIKAGISGGWKGIHNIEKELGGLNIDVDQLIMGEVGTRTAMRFWIEKWWGDSPLKEVFPALFILGNQKDATTAMRKGEWSWERTLETTTEREQFNQISELMNLVSI